MKTRTKTLWKPLHCNFNENCEDHDKVNKKGKLKRRPLIFSFIIAFFSETLINSFFFLILCMMQCRVESAIFYEVSMWGKSRRLWLGSLVNMQYKVIIWVSLAFFSEYPQSVGGKTFIFGQIYVLYNSKIMQKQWESRGGIVVNGVPREVPESSQWSP